MSWSQIKCGFSSADETINFNSRDFATGVDCIYEASTLAVIRSTEKNALHTKPFMLCELLANGIAFAIDRTFICFQPEFDEILTTIDFDVEISAMTSTVEGSTVCLGLSDFRVVRIDVANKRRAVFPPECFPDNAKSSQFHRFVLLGSELLCVFKSGLIVNLNKISSEINYGDDSSVDLNIENGDYQFEILHEATEIKVGVTACSEAAYSHYLQTDCIYFCDTTNLYSWSRRDGLLQCLPLEPIGLIQKMEISADNNYILCLTDKNRLLLLCNRLLCFVRELTHEFCQDFVTLKQVPCALFPTENNYLNFYDLETGDFVFKYKATENTVCINSLLNECVLYVEYSGEEVVDTITVKMIEETHPDRRLDRLLRRGKFDQAKEFALLFSLDEEKVLKAEAQWLMGTLPLWNRFTEDELHGMYYKLVKILDKIKDVRFVTEVCTKTTAPDLRKMQEIINYGLKRISNSNRKMNELQQSYAEIRTLQLTLGTFLKVHGNDSSPNNWLAFSTRNPILICKEFLTLGKLEEASFVCMRHGRQITSELSYDMALTLLHAISSMDCSKMMISWLSVFIPISLKALPRTLHDIINFIIERAKSLEMRNSTDWPQSAEKFVAPLLKTIDDLLRYDNYGSAEAFAVQQSISLLQSPTNQLASFLRQLKMLEVLSNEHKISVSYDSYCQSLQNEEAARRFLVMLFDLVPEQGIETLIGKFIPSYSMALFKNISSIISSYLTCLMTATEEYIYTNPNYLYWEARIVAFINCIPNMEVRLSAIIRLAECAQVPWSRQVSELVDKTLLIKHPLIATLELEKKKIPQKMVLVKYGFCNNAETDDMRMLISYIYRSNEVIDLKSILEEGKQLVGHNEHLRLEPYICLLDYAVTNKCLDNAVDIIQTDLAKEDVHLVYRNVLDALRFKFEAYQRSTRKEKIEQIRCDLLSLLSTLPDPSPNDQGFLARAFRLKSILLINEEYGTKFKRHELFNTNKILETCIFQLAAKSEDDTVLAKKACRLSVLLSQPPYVGVLELAHHYIKAKQFDKAIEPLREMRSYDELFVAQHDKVTQLLIDSALLILNGPNAINKEFFEELVSVAVQNMQHTNKPSLINKFLRLCKLYIVPDMRPSWSSVYTDPVDTSDFRLPDSIYDLIVSNLGRSNVLNSGSLPNMANLTDDLTAFYSSLPKDLTSLSRIVELNFLIGNVVHLDQPILKEMKQAVSSNCKNVIVNVLSSPCKSDNHLALALMQHFLPDQILAWLCYVAKSNRDMKFSRNLSLVVNKYCSLHGQILSSDPDLGQAAQYFSELYKISSWSLRAYRHGIPYKEALADTEDEKLRFLDRLIEVKDIDFKILENYCLDMGLNLQNCYTAYIKHALLSWKPKFTIFKTSSGCSEIIYENDIDALAIRCKTVLLKIQNTQGLISLLLKDVWNQINTYYYEIFSTILEIAATISPSGEWAPFLLSLVFLQSYTRIGPIQDEESTEWFSSNPGDSSLPEIAYYRLPFRSCPLSQKMLQPEISLDTYTKWIGAPSFLLDSKINKDIICALAISNMKNTEQFDAREWNFRHDKGNLLERIMECVEQMDDTETALACLYFVVNHVMRPGVDQVEAAQKCYLKANLWRTETRSRKADSKFAKAEKKYLSISTQHILHSSGLGKPEYLSLISKPIQLIAELYNNPSISQRDSHSVPDINYAAEKIIALHSLDPIKVMLELLVQWLHPESALQSTLTDSVLISEENDDDDISRACYMMMGNRHSTEFKKYLVAQAFPANLNDARKSHGVRLRALRILIAITTPEELEQLTARDPNSIRNYLHVLYFINELEKFGLVYSVDSFNSTRKEVLIETLIRNKNHLSVKLAFKMYRYYSPNEENLMSNLLRLMNALGMMSSLEEALIGIPAGFIDEAVMKESWNSLMNYAIRKVTIEQDGSGFDTTDVEKVVNLLHICPDTNFFDLPSLRSFLSKANEQQAIEYLDFFSNQ